MSNHRDDPQNDEHRTKQSGEFSRDPLFNPAELFDIVETEENVSRVLAAMRRFGERGDAALLARAVAVYVRSARARREPIETVLGALETIADGLEVEGVPGYAQRDTPLRNVLLRGVLLAFYGSEIVDREAAAREERVERRGQARKPDAGPDVR